MANTKQEGSELFPYLGSWVNTDEGTDWVQEFTLAESGGSWTIHAKGAGEPADWGKIPVDVFRFKKGESSIYASFELGNLSADLAAFTNKGLFVVATYLSFHGEPERNFLAREFYVPKRVEGGCAQ